MQNYEKNGNKDTKQKCPRTEHFVIDDNLFKWVCQMKAKNKYDNIYDDEWLARLEMDWWHAMPDHMIY